MIKSLNEVSLPHLCKFKTFSQMCLPCLHTAVQKHINAVWCQESAVFYTLDSDGFTGEESNNVTIVTEFWGHLEQVSGLFKVLLSFVHQLEEHILRSEQRATKKNVSC